MFIIGAYVDSTIIRILFLFETAYAILDITIHIQQASQN